MTSAVRRTLASALAWGVGAGAAIGVGLLALSLIGDGLGVRPVDQLLPNTASQPNPQAASSSDRSFVARPGSTLPGQRRQGPAGSPTPGTPSLAPVPGTPGGPVPSGAAQQISSPGGTVIAQCTDTGVYLVSWSPAQGFRMGSVHRGPNPWANAVFKSPKRDYTVWATCVPGTLQSRIDSAPGGSRDD